MIERGHDGAVHSIAWIKAIASAASGLGSAFIFPVLIEGKSGILWKTYATGGTVSGLTPPSPSAIL